MAELVRSGRVRLNANRARQYGPFTVPNVGYTRLRVSVDLLNADQLDPAKWVGVVAEWSGDAGTTWVPLFQYATWGSLAPERVAMLDDPEYGRPWVECACPPAGSLVRATLSTQGGAVDLGVIVEAW